MDEKELQENFFWSTDEMERQMLLEANMPQFSVAAYQQKENEYSQVLGKKQEISKQIDNIGWELRNLEKD